MIKKEFIYILGFVVVVAFLQKQINKNKEEDVLAHK